MSYKHWKQLTEKFLPLAMRWDGWLGCFSLFCCENQELDGLVQQVDQLQQVQNLEQWLVTSELSLWGMGSTTSSRKYSCLKKPQENLVLHVRPTIHQKMEVKEPLAQRKERKRLPTSTYIQRA